MLTIEGFGGAPGTVAGMEASSSASIIVSRGRTVPQALDSDGVRGPGWTAQEASDRRVAFRVGAAGDTLALGCQQLA